MGFESYSTLYDSCRLIIFPEHKLTKLRFAVNHDRKNTIKARLFNLTNFPWESILKPKVSEQNNWPDWFITGMTANNRRFGLYSEHQIRKLLGMDLIIPSVNQLAEKIAKYSINKDEESSFTSNDGVKLPESQPTLNSTIGKDVQARKNLKGFVIPDSKSTGWQITDDRIAKMVVLTSLALAYFDADNVDLRNQAKESGMIMEYQKPISDEYLDDICKYHRDNKNGYGRYEASLDEYANPIDNLVHSINQGCENDGFPSILGTTNLRKFCRLFC